MPKYYTLGGKLCTVGGMLAVEGAYAPRTVSGGTITYDGDYAIHTFTESGTFIVAGGIYPLDVSVLVLGLACRAARMRSAWSAGSGVS